MSQYCESLLMAFCIPAELSDKIIKSSAYRRQCIDKSLYFAGEQSLSQFWADR